MTTRSTTERCPSLVHDLDEPRSWDLRRPGRIGGDHFERELPRRPVISGDRLLRYVQMMTHDFRHHLSAVYASAEFMGLQSRNPSDAADLLSEVRVAMDCITNQLESLLLFVKTGHEYYPRRQSLTLVIEQAVKMARAHPDAHTVSIVSQLRSEVRGCVDEKRLGSAIFNLILNACQAALGSPLGHREVAVALHDEEESVSVHVTDNGPGVPSEMRDDLFRPFLWDRQNRGIGLGLAIAICVAQEHGGEVYLEMSRPGKTLFVLKLPKGRRETESPRRP